MIWQIGLSKNSLDFLKRNNIEEAVVIDKVRLALRRIQGERINVDLKKLSGEWSGFHRIRIGKMRIIVEFQFEKGAAYVEEIDWRGNVYR